MSWSLPVSINAKPLSVSRLMVPSGILLILTVCPAVLPANTVVGLPYCNCAVLTELTVPNNFSNFGRSNAHQCFPVDHGDRSRHAAELLLLELGENKPILVGHGDQIQTQIARAILALSASPA